MSDTPRTDGLFGYWHAQTHSIEHASKLCRELERELNQWRKVADDLAFAIQEGNNHGYGLRIGDEALDAYNKLKKEAGETIN